MTATARTIDGGLTRAADDPRPPLGSLTWTPSVKTRLAAGNEAGFTIIEVMVAIFILLLGVLGAVTMINTANAITSNNRAREGATNLSRQIIEAARLVDYDSLTAASAPSALQTQLQLADADPSTPGWQLSRRGVKFTVNVSACEYDDGKDGTRSTADTGTFCPASGTPVAPTTTQCATKNPVTPCLDVNPDDFRRLTVDASWNSNGTTRTSTLTALIVNPSGGLGPRITQVGTSPNPPTITTTSPTQFNFTVTTDSRAASVTWQADNNTSGTATQGANNQWTFPFDIKSVNSGNAVLDGNYVINIQAFDALGTPGDLKVQTVTVNRSLPFTPTGLTGGLDSRLTNGSQPTIVDLEWTSNVERDILGYRVYRVNGVADWASGRPAGDPSDTAVCGTGANYITTNFCFDNTWPGGAQSYYVKALDTDPSGNPRESTNGSTVLNVAATPNGTPPSWGGATLTGSIVDGNPRLTWSQAATPGGSGTSIRYYRIYRDGQLYTNRYDHTATGSDLAYTDQDAGGTTHQYSVAAVDDTFQESALLGPVTP